MLHQHESLAGGLWSPRLGVAEASIRVLSPAIRVCAVAKTCRVNQRKKRYIRSLNKVLRSSVEKPRDSPAPCRLVTMETGRYEKVGTIVLILRGEKVESITWNAAKFANHKACLTSQLLQLINV